MQACPECGNHDLDVRVVDGAAVHRCRLCGSTFGGRRAAGPVSDADEAVARGVAPGIWPLVRVLERLPGVRVQRSGGGDVARGTSPFVELGVASPAVAIVQLENLAKSVRLCAALRTRWVIEVDYERTLVFVLRPAAAGASKDAGFDVHDLARQIERDMRLSWWRDGDGTPGG